MSSQASARPARARRSYERSRAVDEIAVGRIRTWKAEPAAISTVAVPAPVRPQSRVAVLDYRGVGRTAGRRRPLVPGPLRHSAAPAARTAVLLAHRVQGSTWMSRWMGHRRRRQRPSIDGHRRHDAVDARAGSISSSKYFGRPSVIPLDRSAPPRGTDRPPAVANVRSRQSKRVGTERRSLRCFASSIAVASDRLHRASRFSSALTRRNIDESVSPPRLSLASCDSDGYDAARPRRRAHRSSTPVLGDQPSRSLRSWSLRRSTPCDRACTSFALARS